MSIGSKVMTGRIVPLSELEAITAERVRLGIFHGTPVPPLTMGSHIEPRQSLTKDYDGNMVPHGDPAISTSDRVEPFPVIRSLLHAAHPSLARTPNLPLTFGREVDIRGKAHYFAGALALRALLESQGVGYVYGCEGEGVSDIYPGREDLGERRSVVSLPWLFAAETHVDNLPSSLKVIDASEEKTWEFLNALPHNEYSAEFADRVRVSVIDLRVFLASA